MDPDGKATTDNDAEVPVALAVAVEEEVLSERMPTKEEQELIVVQQQGEQQQQLQQVNQNQGSSNKTTTVSVTINSSGGDGSSGGGLYMFLMRAFKSPDTPEGYNSKRRFTARWILWGVVFGLLRSPRFLLVALLCSVASIAILKEGTFWSGKNLKWRILSLLSLAVSVLSWSFRRAHDAMAATIEEDEDEKGWHHRHPILKMLKLVLHLSSKWMTSVWAAILGLFLLSAFLGSKKDQEALKAAVVKGAETAGKGAEVVGQQGKIAADVMATQGKIAAEVLAEQSKIAADVMATQGKIAADVLAEQGHIAAEKGKKVAGKAAGAASKKLDEFSKKME
mmetsp:Transcript_3180/g.3585  ORF Transcript_3180/g.3585 Transcript_3180/m.3585 type:complete len:337 (+) Transcript_3180:132-1142(+)